MRSEQEMSLLQNKLMNKIQKLERQLGKLPLHGERRRILEREIDVIKIEIRLLKWMTYDKAYGVKVVSEDLERKRKELFG